MNQTRNTQFGIVMSKNLSSSNSSIYSERVSETHGWFDLPLGRLMMELETASIRRLLPQRYYPVVVQTHGPCRLPTSVVELYGSRFEVFNSQCVLESGYIVANMEQLPFGPSSVDLLLMPHVLEFSEYPHELLREVSECIVPEGILAMSCFNPRSILGLVKYLHRFSGTIIDDSRLYSTVRIKDWLNLLGFQVIAGEFVFFRPLFTQQVRLNRFQFLETAGARWWPSMGSIYILIARKKEYGVRPQQNRVTSKFRIRNGYLRPMAEKNLKQLRQKSEYTC